jgi:hypothetical protein
VADFGDRWVPNDKRVFGSPNWNWEDRVWLAYASQPTSDPNSAFVGMKHDHNPAPGQSECS